MPWYDTRAKKWRFRKSGGGTGSSPSKSLAKLAAAASKDRAFKVKHGLLPATSARHAEMEKVDLVDHLAAYMKHQRNKGRDPKYIKTVELRLPKLFALGRFRRFADITSTSIAAALAAYADSGVSQQTVRHGLSQTKWFLNWCVEDGRIPANPISGAKAPPVTEQKYKRRAATPEEAAKILAAASRIAFTGQWKAEDKIALLAIYLGAGFRRGDCIGLMVEHFRLDCDMPHIVIRASSSKNRKGGIQPINGDLRQYLLPWLAKKKKGQKVFPCLTAGSRISKMVKRCCEKAGIPFVNEDGRLDGHALRHTYGTRAGENGDIKTVQELMRHSSIKTTEKYMHTDDAKKRATIEGLPKLGGRNAC
jgi:integrase/recombinase XerC